MDNICEQLYDASYVLDIGNDENEFYSQFDQSALKSRSDNDTNCQHSIEQLCTGYNILEEHCGVEVEQARLTEHDIVFLSHSNIANVTLKTNSDYPYNSALKTPVSSHFDAEYNLEPGNFANMESNSFYQNDEINLKLRSDNYIVLTNSDISSTYNNEMLSSSDSPPIWLFSTPDCTNVSSVYDELQTVGLSYVITDNYPANEQHQYRANQPYEQQDLTAHAVIMPQNVAQEKHKPVEDIRTSESSQLSVKTTRKQKYHHLNGYECTLCDRTFITRGGFTQHNRIHHSGPRQYRCRQCGKRYQFQQQLEAHEKRHASTGKPFPCKNCPKGFWYSTDLDRHFKLHHGIAPDKCPECGKGFVRPGHLFDHMQTHAGRKARRKALLERRD